MKKNLSIVLSSKVENSLRKATDLASSFEFVSLEHVLLALVENQDIQKVLNSCHVDLNLLKRDLKQFLNSQYLLNKNFSPKSLPDFTLAFLRLLQRADIQVHGSGKNEVNVYHLLVAFFEEKHSYAVYALEKQGVTQFDIIYYTTHGTLPQQDVTDPLTTPLEKHRRKTLEKRREGGGAMSEAFSPIERFTINLNEKVKKEKMGSSIVRKDVLGRVIQVISRKTKNNPLLVGEEGVGKTILAYQLASRIVNKEEVPEKLKESVIYSLDIGSMLAGTKYRGDFEERFKALLEAFKNQKEHIILFVDEIHNLIGAGGTAGSSIDASNLLKPSLSDGSLSCIGTTTYKESRQHFEKDRGLARRFQKIDVLEPSEEETLSVVFGLKEKYESFHDVTYSQTALKAVVDLSGRYIHDRMWPDKAIDVMDEVGAFVNLNEKARSKKVLVKDVEKVVAKMSKMPLISVSSSDKQRIFNLEFSLKSVIFGQDTAIKKLVASIKKARIGIHRIHKPIGTYFFAGPTGVGKTEMARQLSIHLGIHFHRLDMSEYMEKHSVARLVGAPPGYVGHEEGGLLTEKVREKPYSVLLLDEIEKAHPDLINILLQVMDCGRLTDSSGRSTDFTHVILIMTSNAGADEGGRHGLGIRPDSRSERSLHAVRNMFRPEFINRLDAVVEFKALQKPILIRVIDKFLKEFSSQLKKKRVIMGYSESVVEWLFHKGYDPEYGARTFERAVEEHIKNPIVDDLLFGRLSRGGRFQVKTNKMNKKKLDFIIEK